MAESDDLAVPEPMQTDENEDDDNNDLFQPIPLNTETDNNNDINDNQENNTEMQIDSNDEPQIQETNKDEDGDGDGDVDELCFLPLPVDNEAEEQMHNQLQQSNIENNELQIANNDNNNGITQDNEIKDQILNDTDDAAPPSIITNVNTETNENNDSNNNAITQNTEQVTNTNAIEETKTNAIDNDDNAMMVEEIMEEEDGGCVMEEVIDEEEGGIVAPPAIITNNESENVNVKSEIIDNSEQKTNAQLKSESPPKPKPNTQAKQENDSQNNNNNTDNQTTEDDQPRAHPLTTDSTKERYLNLTLMKQWTTDEVILWLTKRFGLWGQQYVTAFSKDGGLNGDTLSKLTKDDLKTKYGVTKLIHLERMHRDIYDSKRPISQMNKMIAPCFIDGGTVSSKFCRFTAVEVDKWARKIIGLKMYAETFKSRQISGQVLLECTAQQLVSAMANEVTLIDTKGILTDYIIPIKNEENIKADMKEYEAIVAVHEVWSECASLSEMQYKLLPQYLRDFKKSEVRYAPPEWPPNSNQNRGPPNHGPPSYYNQGNQQYQNNQSNYNNQSGYDGGNSNKPTRKRRQHRPAEHPMEMGGDPSNSNQGPAMHESKNIMEWTTEDCINWLGLIKESKVDLRVRYTPHFAQIKVTGKDLINMTPNTLASLCCITTKTHLKQIVKAIDKIRDHMVYKTFGSQEHVKEFMSKYGAHFSPSVPKYYQSQHTQQRYNAPVQHPQTPHNPPTNQQQPPVHHSQPPRSVSGSSAGNRNDGGNNNRAMVQKQNVHAQSPKKQINSKNEVAADAKCIVCGATGNVMRCSQCKKAFYCSRDHQVSDWARHSKECNK